MIRSGFLCARAHSDVSIGMIIVIHKMHAVSVNPAKTTSLNQHSTFSLMCNEKSNLTNSIHRVSIGGTNAKKITLRSIYLALEDSRVRTLQQHTLDSVDWLLARTHMSCLISNAIRVTSASVMKVLAIQRIFDIKRSAEGGSLVQRVQSDEGILTFRWEHLDDQCAVVRERCEIK